jgi:tetratricopeptide (TPR) repeat protein
MEEPVMFPRYIRRAEEDLIQRQVARVVADRQTRAVLLYGAGGIGKTSLVRELAEASEHDDSVTWVAPIDIDDSEYWLLSNLEREIALHLDPENQYFEPYVEYLDRLPSFTRADVSHETVVSHLGRIKQIFMQCYERYVEDTGKAVVIVFDTIEAIRGMYLQVTLTQWMKRLPATLFILSGRPPRDPSEEDFLLDELNDPHGSIPFEPIELTEFSREAALEYLKSSSISAGLDQRAPEEQRADPAAADEEKQKLILLTRGHPLWLAFAISYLQEKGLPEEAAGTLEEIERLVPYDGEISAAGQNLCEDFKRRLVTPYKEADFWHEAIKRLAVIRQSVSEPVWRELMADHPLPPGVNLDATWDQLLERPWIRKRANGRFVTLHDAVAEELAERIIPLHDGDQQWRRQLWERAVEIYVGLTDGPEAELNDRLAAVDERLRSQGPTLREGDGGLGSAPDQREFIREVAALDAEKRELDQFKAARLFYELLADPAAGCDQFLKLFGTATAQHDVLFEDLLALEMQRFLPGDAYTHALGDVIANEIERFRAWLAEAPERYAEITLAMAGYFVEERPQAALDLLAPLSDLPEGSASYTQLIRMHTLRGNACMRLPGRVREGEPHFDLALAEAQSDRVPVEERPILVARAHKELGYYHRNGGKWEEADKAYERARDSILPTLSLDSPPEDREEMASIQTNWAYVKGLVGKYREGSNLVESAIKVRHRLGRLQEEGNSWSVCGEVYRYERRFQLSWNAFEQADQIFQELKNWSWLGVIYQEKAICLFQAMQDGLDLGPDPEPLRYAKILANRALDICRDQHVRGYPSALNRAGRIFGHDDVDAAIGYLSDGIEWARTLSDGWFLLANLTEYAEANFRAWQETEKTAYIDQIAARRDEIEAAIEEYDFPDLKGRWLLLQGHLAIRAWRESHEDAHLDVALENYKEGFELIARGYVGSSGAAALPGEFEIFVGQVQQLPLEVRATWYKELQVAWRGLQEGSTLVLARLEEIY